MDYFNELLESYARLKKRTFKLTFINEQEEGEQIPPDVLQKARELANQAITSAPQGAPEVATPVNNVKGEATTYKIYYNINTKNVNVVGLGANGGELTVRDQNRSIKTDAFNKFVQVLAKGQTPEQKAIADQEQAELDQAMAEQQELEMLNQQINEKVGGAYVSKRWPEILREARARNDRSVNEKVAKELAMKELIDADYVPIGGRSVISSYKKQLRYANIYRKQLLAQYPDGLPADLQKELKGFMDNPINFIAGGSSGSFERQLVLSGTGFTLDDKGNKIETNLDPEAIQDAVLANEFLLSFLDPSNDDPYKCAQIRKKIGVQKTGRTRQFVLFGPESGADGTPTGGVVITANKVQKRALDAAAQKCPEEAKNLDAIINGKFQGNNKNAIKGSIYEVVPRITVLLNKLTSAKDKKAIKKELKDFIEEVLLDEKLPILEEIAAQSGALSLDSFIEQQEAVEQLNIISSKKNLAAWLLTEARIMNSFISMLPEPDDVLHVALSPKQGDRPDNTLIYKDLKEAEESAKRSEGKVTTYTKSQILELIPKNKKTKVRKQLDALGYGDNDPIHLVNMAQKRMVAHDDAKAGEVSRQELMRGYVLGKDPNGNAAEGFFDAVDEQVKLTDAQVAYFNSVENYVERAVAPFRNPTIYTDKGGLKIQKPEQIAEMVAKNLKGKFTQKQIQDLNLTQLFFDGDDPRDFEDRIVQERIAEGLERNLRMSRYKSDLKNASGEEKRNIEAVLLRQALVCGYTLTDMAQVKGTDDGTLRAWSHNAPFKQAVEDWKSGNLTISVQGLQVSFTGTGKTGEPMTYVKYSQEGTKTGSGDNIRRDTRSQTKFTKEAQDEFNFLNKSKK